VAEGGGLLNRYRTKSSIGGSNPPLSATTQAVIIRPDSVKNRALYFLELTAVFSYRYAMFCLLRKAEKEDQKIES
jgi:hypothetical protein